MVRGRIDGEFDEVRTRAIHHDVVRCAWPPVASVVCVSIRTSADVPSGGKRGIGNKELTMDQRSSWGTLLTASLFIGALTLAPHAAHAAPIGTADNFSGDAIGSFPAGWLDVAAVDPASPAPKPSALVVGTTDAHGNPIHALGTLPAIAPSQGIYRVVPLSSAYSSKADVRVDRFSDFAAGTNPTTDWAMAVGINQLQGTTDPAFIPSIQIYASAITHSWRLFAATADVS